ncbi:MAG: DUF2117 domain-containing protein [Methanobrevibacter sp.]|uniref:DUF2117 domain-containing protein n=1 Tax=Methanobrevibacter sp. TaxID=66852 RepID=UPI0025E85F63|nr:DUF2117 domain-containing protein [Methanobrevibacter sp.]MBR0271191.1 DUF2117 domain-containing protein [Methanobrevibacter sp.]
MKIGIVVHGPNIIDSGHALKLIDLIREYGEVSVRLGGTMGRTAVIDKSLENIIDISKKLVPSDSLKIFHDDKVDIIFLLNYGKSSTTGQVFGYKVYSHYKNKISQNSIPIIQIERPGEADGSVINWAVKSSLAEEFADNLNLNMVTPDEIYEKHIRDDEKGQTRRTIHGVSPGENIMVNSVVIGRATSDKLTLVSKDNHISEIIGGEIKPHGVEKLGYVNLNEAIVKTGLLRKAKVTPRVLDNAKSENFKVAFLDHAGEDVYQFRDSSLVITIGDDTTLISSDILYRFNIPIIGITDGDLDKVVEEGFKSKNSVIFEVESGNDDIIGNIIQKELFNNEKISENFTSIDEVESKIVEIINNRNIKYTINKI